MGAEDHVCRYKNFNPRSRVGNDDDVPDGALDKNISIHVPAWGTTAWKSRSSRRKTFQSTFPRGERPERPNAAVSAKNFNPRSRVGNDCIIRLPLYFSFISIHVPAWGTTEFLATENKDNVISIHVPAWGTTANFNNFSPILLYRYYKSAFYITPSF